MRLLALLFGCRHARMSFPMKLKREKMPHVTCLCCGREFWYSFERMERLGELPAVQFGSIPHAARREPEGTVLVRSE